MTGGSSLGKSFDGPCPHPVVEVYSIVIRSSIDMELLMVMYLPTVMRNTCRREIVEKTMGTVNSPEV